MVIRAEILRHGMADLFELTGVGRPLSGNGGPITGGFYEMSGLVTLVIADGTSRRQIHQLFRKGGWTIARIRTLGKRNGKIILARLSAKRNARPKHRDYFD